MHSRIFQASLNPIEKYDYIEESNYWDHWFTREWADYVNGDCDRKDDIEWLKSCYGTKGIEFGTDDNGEYFIVKSKQAYFENSFNEFTEILNKIKDYTLDDFVHGFHEMWSLKNAYEDKMGFYADYYGSLITFDEFIRECATEEKYYIGGTIEYHF
jgi:hypothetical protein